MRRLSIAALAIACGCDFESELAPREAVPVIVDGSGMASAETDLGYIVQPTRCRSAIADIEFTTDGEKHAGLGKAVLDVLVPTAYAHPGHYAGGEIVGELPGRFVFDWREDGQTLGEATMLHARYNGANFTFARARVEDGVAVDDPIIGHTFDIGGVAHYGDASVTFDVLMDEDEDKAIIGAPLDVDVDGSNAPSLGLVLALTDPFESDSVFDGLDFLALDEDGDGHVAILPETDAYNRLRRNLQVHDHYWISVR